MTKLSIPKIPENADESWHVVIDAPNALRRHVRRGNGPGLDMTALARAEAALEGLNGEFEGWMDGEIERLSDASIVLAEHGYDEESLMTLFRVAHDIKGQAATFGYPLAARIADSLCTMIDSVPDKTRIPSTLIDQHLQSIRAIVTERCTGEGTPIARTLAKRLCDVSLEFMRMEIARDNTAPSA